MSIAIDSQSGKTVFAAGRSGPAEGVIIRTNGAVTVISAGPPVRSSVITLSGPAYVTRVRAGKTVSGAPASYALQLEPAAARQLVADLSAALAAMDATRPALEVLL